MNKSYITFDQRPARKLAPTNVQPHSGQRLLFALALCVAMAVGLAVGIPSAHAQGSAPAGEMAKVNINTADAQSLASGLKGVGESRAEEIVRYREAYGPFTSAEELAEVKGIGKSTLDMNRQVITLE